MAPAPHATRRPRVLFFAEAVTLAHVARPIALARQLDAAHVEAIVACDPRCERFLAPEAFRTEPLPGIGSGEFMRRLASGSPVFKAAELRAYVRDDLALIERVKPDLVVGDFRLSLSVSARLARVPYATVTNAYWSPFAAQQRMPLPVLPISRCLPLPVARGLFGLAQPIAMRAHAAALNRVRAEHGLAPLGHDLRRVYTDADFVLYADHPQLFGMHALPSHHHFLGALEWSPAVATPSWWRELPPDKPTVYLALGSSGDPRVLRDAVDALAALPVNVIVSTAGGGVDRPNAANLFIADYVDGAEAAKRSQLVVCNGGSMACQQAIAAGVPTLGIASNMDQFLNMAAISKAGVGTLLRADRVSVPLIRAAAAAALADAQVRLNAQVLRNRGPGSVLPFAEFAQGVFTRQ